jgi:hypothetical protein
VVTNDVGWLPEQGQHWAGLQSQVMVESTREIIAGTEPARPRVVITLNTLKRDTKTKLGIANKRLKAG